MKINPTMHKFIQLLFVTMLAGCAKGPVPIEPASTGFVKTPQSSPLPSQLPPTETPVTATTPTKMAEPLPVSTATFTPLPRLAPGTIYGVETGVYGSLLPIDDYGQATNQIVPVQSGIPRPSFSVAIGLSNYSGQVAYVTKENQDDQNKTLRLYVGDLMLQKVDLVWTDWDADLLDYEPENGDIIDIRWGPGDQSVIVRNRKKFVISSLTHQNDMIFTGICDELVWLPETKQWILACTGETDRGNGESDPRLRGFVMKDGTVHTERLPSDSQAFQIKDWAFSPDGQSVLYADLDGKLFIGKPDGTIQPVLPFRFQEPYPFSGIRALQWSADGKQLLIWGSDPTSKYCPTENICWLVIEANTNKVVWYPSGEALKSISDATLSPDGQWIALFIMNLPQRYGAIISLKTNQMIKISNWPSEEIRWVK